MTETATDLLATDRCDRCGARACVRGAYGLLFCNHHAREHGLIATLPQHTAATSGHAGRAES